MKLCPRCNMQLEDSASFCPNCGTQFIPNATVSTPPYIPANPFDHTADYDPKDIVENKLYASCCYLLSFLGVIIAVLIAKDSPFVQFHIRQSLKISICEVLLSVFAGLLALTFLVPIAAAICIIILVIVSIICFFRTIKGKAVDVPIIRSLNFLK